jgi:zinc protease
MKDYKGSAAVAQGEVFVATPDTIDKRTTRGELPPGLKVALLPKKTKGEVVRLALTIRFGNETELKGNAAAAALLPQMLMRGTKKHTFQQLKDELDRLRAEVSCGGGGRITVPNPGVTQCRVKTVRANLPGVLRLLAEMLREPAFAPAEFETLRKEALTQLEEQLQDPMANGFVTLTQKLFPWPREDVRHVPGVKEAIEQLKTLKLPEMVKLHRTLWGAGAAQLALVGDFDAAEVRALLEKELGAWKSSRPYERVTRPFRAGEVAEEVIDTPDKEMAFVGVGHPLELREDDPDYPALVMVNHLLGGSASSRLLQRLRQKEGLSYGAFSGIHAHPLDKSGFFFAGAICAPQNADKAMRLMLEELDTFRRDGVADKELTEGKRSYAQSFEARLAEDDFVTGELAQGLFIGRTFAFWKTLNDRIARLTAAEVTAAARKYLDPAKLARVSAGDRKKQKKS